MVFLAGCPGGRRDGDQGARPQKLQKQKIPQKHREPQMGNQKQVQTKPQKGEAKPQRRKNGRDQKSQHSHRSRRSNRRDSAEGTAKGRPLRLLTGHNRELRKEADGRMRKDEATGCWRPCGEVATA